MHELRHIVAFRRFYLTKKFIRRFETQNSKIPIHVWIIKMRDFNSEFSQESQLKLLISRFGANIGMKLYKQLPILLMRTTLNRYLRYGFFAKNTYQFWPVINYGRIVTHTGMFIREDAHTHFTINLLRFWTFLATTLEDVWELTDAFDAGSSRSILKCIRWTQKPKIRYFLKLYQKIICLIPTLLIWNLKKQISKVPSFIVLQLNTQLSKLWINIQTRSHKNLFFLYPGLFQTFLNKSKASKRSKNIRMLMLKYLHYILLVGAFPYISFEMRGLPAYFNDILVTITAHPTLTFLEISRTIFWTSFIKRYRHFKTPFFWFRDVINYSKQKLRQRGRIKRKIWRKLHRQSGIID